MGDPAAFLKIKRQDQPLRSVEARLSDWREIYQPSLPGLNVQQASRCMDCGVPFCQSTPGCPLGNLIPDWNELVSRERWVEALDRLHATNNFPEFTGRLCPAPCESACVLGLNSASVTIKSIEWSIIERGFEAGLVRPRPPKGRTGHTIAIVGSGPAGLAAAQQLARRGHSVTVFEKAARPGGLLRYGIPDFKFEKYQVDRRLRQLEEEGVRFQTGVALGCELTLEQLRCEFSAVALAIGAERPRDLARPGRELEGVHFAMDYLVEKNKEISGELIGARRLSARGRDVLILGGGDTGSDCLGTVLRDGARSVRQIELLGKPPVERAPETPWPEWPRKLRTSHAHQEGGWRGWSMATEEFLGSNGRLERVRVEATRAEGGASEAVDLVSDFVLLAMGYAGPAVDFDLTLDHDARGNLALDADFMTSQDGIFAAGDAHRGASLIVWAIAEGRQMAAGIDRYLSLRNDAPSPKLKA